MSWANKLHTNQKKEGFQLHAAIDAARSTVHHIIAHKNCTCCLPQLFWRAFFCIFYRLNLKTFIFHRI